MSVISTIQCCLGRENDRENSKVGRERFELSTFRLSAERSNHAEPTAQLHYSVHHHAIKSYIYK